MSETTLVHERVDDIPLLIGLLQRLHFAEVLNRHLDSHGNHRGLSNGTLATVWLAFILCMGDHRKSTVEAWVEKHHDTLARLLEVTIRPTDFTDDRLGIVLKYLGSESSWNDIEEDLWRENMQVLPPGDAEPMSVRVDATTVTGYHAVTEEGLMQLGHSKDHRPDLGQFKLMAAAVQPGGGMVATSIHSGESADDPLYVPIIRRVRQILKTTGVLYSGDCKMAASKIRADIAFHRDEYLTPLPMTGDTAKSMEAWIAAAVDGRVDCVAIEDHDLIDGGPRVGLSAVGPH
jgi:transposase